MRFYRFIDWATQAYLAIVVLIVLGAVAVRSSVPTFWVYIVGAHLGAMAGLHAVVHFGSAPKAPEFLRFLREFYPILLYTGFYRETEWVNRILGLGRIDEQLIRLEHLIFQLQPSVVLMDRYPQVWLSELLYAAYFSYYLMIGGMGLYLLLKHPPIFRHFVAVVSFVFYVCYLVYMFVPVVGPRLFYQRGPERRLFSTLYGFMPPDVPESVQSGVFFGIMGWIYKNFEAASAAFPSSHVAIAITTAWFSWQYFWPVRWFHATAVALLCVSTVYCRYHYSIDVPAGILFAAVLIPIGNKLYWRWDRPVPVYPKAVEVDHMKTAVIRRQNLEKTGALVRPKIR